MTELFDGSEFSPKTQESVNLALDEIGKKLTYFFFVLFFTIKSFEFLLLGQLILFPYS